MDDEDEIFEKFDAMAFGRSFVWEFWWKAVMGKLTEPILVGRLCPFGRCVMLLCNSPWISSKIEEPA